MANDKAQKRALDSLSRGLTRGDAVLAWEGFVALGANERGPFLDRVAGLASADILRCRTRASWGAVVPWAKRLEAQPEVWLALPPTLQAEVAWALMWGCGLASEWARAAAFWARVSSQAAVQNPAFADAVEQWIAARGKPVFPEALAQALGASNEAVDPRLGMDPVRSRPVSIAPPASLADAESVVVRARAVLGLAGFPAWLDRLPKAPHDPVACKVHGIAAQLALRDVLIEVETGAPVSAALDGFATCVLRGGVTIESVLTAFRLLARKVQRGEAVSSRAFGILAGQCADDVALRSVVREAVLGLVRGLPSRPSASMCEPLLAALEAIGAREAPLSAAVWASGAVLALRREFAEHRAEPRESRCNTSVHVAWIEKRLPEAVAATTDLAEWIRTSDKVSVQGLFAFAGAMPLESAKALIRAAATTVREPTVPAFVTCVRSILERVTTHAPTFCQSCGVYHEEYDDDGHDDLAWAKLSPEGKHFWVDIEALVLRHSFAFLGLALDRATTPAAQGEIVERYLATAVAPTAWLDAWDELRKRKSKRAPKVLESMLARFVDVRSLVAASRWALERRHLAAHLGVYRALLAAVDATSTPVSREDASIVSRARTFLVFDDAKRARRGKVANRRKARGRTSEEVSQ
jgi:hypothetical protein